MITVHLPSRMREELNLDQKTVQLKDFRSGSIQDLLTSLDTNFPGAINFLCDDQGAIRKHIKVFLSEEQVTEELSTVQLHGHENIRIIQAMAGG